LQSSEADQPLRDAFHADVINSFTGSPPKSLFCQGNDQICGWSGHCYPVDEALAQAD